MLSDIFINDLDDGTKHTFSKFACNTKLRWVADAQPDCAAVQKNIEWPEK